MMMKMKTMMTIDLEGKAMGPEDGTPSPFFTSFKPLYFVQKHFKQPRLVYKTKKKKKKESVITLSHGDPQHYYKVQKMKH